MIKEDLQTFRSHPSIWEEGPDKSSHVSQPPDSIKDSNSHHIHQLNISWPLTSFANTIQNVCCISFLMGFFFCLNLSMIFIHQNPKWTRLNIYFLLIISFHLLEFLTTAIFNTSRVTIDSFLLNNGISYWLSQAFCVLEYVITKIYFPKSIMTSNSTIIQGIGLGISFMGQIIRTISMITAANSFNHKVSNRQQKEDDHILITHGIYRFLRHPSYFGFFWWSLGIQLFLGNPLSFAIFSAVLWNFFNSRIHYEEYHLVKFFKQAYIDYRSTTPTYIPFIG